MEKIKLLSPMNDVVFKCLFGKQKNEEITRSLISSILGKEIGELDLERNTNLIPEYPDKKFGIVDVKAVDKETGIIYNVEMQVCNTKELPERMLYYWGILYTNQLEKGEEYKELKPTIVIMLLNDRIENLETIEKAHTKWNIREEEYREIILTGNLEIHIIEIPKYLETVKEEDRSKLRSWLEFLEKPESGGKMVSEEEIEKAREELAKISSNEELRDIILRREIWEHDQASRIGNARREGEEKGRQEGIAKNRKEIIIEMLKEGMPKEQIAKIVKVEIKEIEKIAKSI